jgi:hypothetical protein
LLTLFAYGTYGAYKRTFKKQFLLTMQIENKEQYPDNFDAKWLYKLKQLSVVSIASKQRVGTNFFLVILTL